MWEKLKKINLNNKAKQSSIQNQIIKNSPERKGEINNNTEDDDKDDMEMFI
jgi:hypothetical protein